MEPLKRLQSPISTASDTAVRTLTPRRQARRLAVGAELAVVVETGDGLIKPVAARGGVHHRIVGVIEGRQRTGPHADHMVAADTLQPGVVDPGPRPGAVIDDPAAQQHLGQAVAGGHQVAAGIGARAHQVTGPLPGTGRDPHRDDIVVARQAGQQDRVPAIGLDPLAARAQQLGGRRHLAGDPLLGQGPASSKPVGPASQRHLDVPVPRPQAGDQRHDLAGITGHRPLNQLTRQRVDRRGLDGTGMNIQSQTCTLGKHRGLLCMSAPRPPNSRNDPRGCIREAPARKPSDPTPYSLRSLIRADLQRLPRHLRVPKSPRRPGPQRRPSIPRHSQPPGGRPGPGSRPAPGKSPHHSPRSRPGLASGPDRA